MTQVFLQDLYKIFGKDVIAVDHVNLTIKDKEFFCLLGPSGCGKTTTLRIIAGLETQTQGNILFDDVNVNNLPPNQRNIAMAFEDYALYPLKSVYNNIAYPLQIRKLNKVEIDDKVSWIADILDIKSLLNRLPNELSGGQRQRVGVARALVRNPSVFLLDEPISHLDAKLRSSLRVELKRIQKEMAITTLYVTHDQLEAITMADQIGVMNYGAIQQIGSPEELFNKPVNRFVAQFIGEPSMNFLPCNLIEENRQPCLKGESFCYPITDHLKYTIEKQATSSALLFAFRPQFATIQPDERAAINGKAVFKARVYITEPLGTEQLVNLQIGSERIRVVTEPDMKLDLDTEVWVEVKQNKFMVFDEKTDKAIL